MLLQTVIRLGQRSDIPRVRKIPASFSVTERTAGAQLCRLLRPPQNEGMAADEHRAKGAVASTSLSNYFVFPLGGGGGCQQRSLTRISFISTPSLKSAPKRDRGGSVHRAASRREAASPSEAGERCERGGGGGRLERDRAACTARDYINTKEVEFSSQ